MTNKEIGILIRQKREELNLSCEQVAESVGVSKSTVSRWETGEIESIKRGHIYLLAKCLYLPVEKILGIDTSEQIENPDTARLKIEIINAIEKIQSQDTLRSIKAFVDLINSPHSV